MPVELANAVGVRAHREGRELRIGHHRHADVQPVRLPDELALVERGYTAGVVRDHYVRVGFFFHHLNLAPRSERAREVALDENVPEAKAATVEPRRVITHLRAEGHDERRDGGRALAAVNVRVVDRVFLHQFVVMAGRVHGDRDVRETALLLGGDAVTDGVHPFGIVDDLLWHHHRLAEFLHDVAHLMPQFGVVHHLLAHFFVMAIGGAAVNDGKVARLVRRGELPHGQTRLRRSVRGGRGVIIPGRAGGLVGRVIVFEAQLAVEPEDRGRIAGDVTALPARLVVPGEFEGDFLLAPEFRHHFDVRLWHALDDPLALGFQLEDVCVEILRRVFRLALELARGFGVHRIVGDKTGCGCHRVARVLSTLCPARSVSLAVGAKSRNRRTYKSYPASSNFSSITSFRIMCRPSSTSAIMSLTPVLCQIKYSSMMVLSSTCQPVAVVWRVSGGRARRHTSSSADTSRTCGPQAGKASGWSMSGETCVPVPMIL